MNDDEIPAEPAVTQEWIGGGTWGGVMDRRRKKLDDPAAEERWQDDRQDLLHVDDPNGRWFARENPNADINDFMRWKDAGRWMGNPARPTSPDMGRSSRSMGRR